MSLLPLKTNQDTVTWYGNDPYHPHNNNYNYNNIHGTEQEGGNEETIALLVGSPGRPHHVDFPVAELVMMLFLNRQPTFPGPWQLQLQLQQLQQQHPKTNPIMIPERRFRRHRNKYIFRLNEFRHWWKTSRLLVRLSGGYEYCYNPQQFQSMAMYDVHKRKQAKGALNSMKAIGRGGPAKDFLSQVQPVRVTV